MERYIISLVLALFSFSAFSQGVITVYDENTGKEEPIGLPEGMMQEEIDSMMRHWYASTYLTYDCAA